MSVSTLRAVCHRCRAHTAVAVGDGYECHSCGVVSAAGLVRVPTAFGAGGEEMAAAAWLPLPYPEAAVVERHALEEQTAALAAGLPVRPLVLGGCCCAHTGAIRGLSARVDRLAVVWLDAHGDVNTEASSPSGNAWGMPLRASLDAGDVEPAGVALVGVRNLDPPEAAFLAETGIDDDMTRAVAGADGVYVAFDCDVLDPAEIDCFMPEPGGLSVSGAERMLRDLAGERPPVLGVGLTGLRPTADVRVLTRLVSALGL